MPRGSKARTLSTVAWDELSKHNVPGDAWIAVRGNAYDVSQWAGEHPGGDSVLHLSAGQDATDAFEAYHPTKTFSQLQRFLVGPMERAERKPLSESMEDYRKLRQAISEDGACIVDSHYYVQIAVCLTLLLVACFTFVFLQQAIPAALALGIFWHQAAFVGHDAGHNTVFKKREHNMQLGVAVTAFVGIGLSWWKDTHNTHHTVCNSATCDPDIQHLPILAPSPCVFKGFWSTYHNAPFHFDRLAKALVSIQHCTFFPLLFVAKFFLLGSSVRHLFIGKAYYNQKIELCAAVFFVSWVLALAYSFPTWAQRAIFIALSQGITGVLHLQISMSHWSRPHYNGLPEEGEWLKTQVEGTMDWDCPPWMDWLHGGLQFQVEHHIFPSVPRCNLRKLKPLVQSLCKKHNLDYHSPPFFTGVAELFFSLWKVAKQASLITDH